MSKLTIFAGTLVVAFAAFSVHAQPVTDPGAYCNFVAGYAEAVAKDRDNGTKLYQALEVASDVEHKGLRSDLILVTQMVHVEPHEAPIKEAGIAFEFCWAVYGEQ